MSKDKKHRKYSLLFRILGASCTFLLLASLISIAVAGLSFASGFLLAASLTGLIGPSVAASESLWEMLVGVFDLIVESIQTLLEVIVDTFSSLFG